MTVPIRVLICEDSDDDAVLIAAHLRRGGLTVEYERVVSAAAMAEALRRRAPDLVISDYSMPGFGAQEALGVLRETGLDVPLIIVSGRIGEESAVTLMRAGAHDFILKNRMARLVPAVRRELRQARSRREQRAAEEALRVSEQRFRLFAEHAPDVLFRYRIHPSPWVEYFSPAAQTVLGCRPEDLLGDPAAVFSVVAEEDRPNLEAAWQSPSPEPLVVRWRRPDGTDAWTEQRAVGLRDEQGRIVAVEGILRDITDQVLADAQRDRLQQQLRQAERLESLGRLAGGIAHDFNNLLAVILGHADLILAELPEDGTYRADMEFVRQLAERGAAMTRQLLVFSRQEPLRPETLDVNKAVTETEQILRRAIGEDIDLEARLAPDLYPVTIDRSELERLLLNLVANSRRAMPHGGRLTIQTSNVEAAVRSADDAEHGSRAEGRIPGAHDVMVRLCVTDTGSGMSESVAKHAFEPFFTTDPVTGTGLGLSTAYGVVKAAGGDISLISGPGEGTTVRIDLPASDRAPTAARQPDPPPAGGDGETVLVVEDDEDVRNLVALMLRRSDYLVIEAPSPAHAMALVEAGHTQVDAMLTDVVMSGISGIELIGQVRGRLPGLPVLLMSGYTAGALPEGFTMPEEISMIRKPFTKAALLRALDEVLRHAR